MARDIEEKVVFGIGTGADGVPTILLGVTEKAWAYMRDGKTHTFDLRSIGVPVKIVAFGAADHTAVIQMLEAGAKASGSPILDARNRDFSIEPGGTP
ncbi:MAG: hypothetical protein J0H94_11915 [Rhizobiales bacterium]|nr:hypothetical protein [Hyphomicrobiales bacterium]